MHLSGFKYNRMKTYISLPFSVTTKRNYIMKPTTLQRTCFYNKGNSLTGAKSCRVDAMYCKPINTTIKRWSPAKSVLHYSTLLHKKNMYINQKNEIILRVYPTDNSYLPIIYNKAGTTLHLHDSSQYCFLKFHFLLTRIYETHLRTYNFERRYQLVGNFSINSTRYFYNMHL